MADFKIDRSDEIDVKASAEGVGDFTIRFRAPPPETRQKTVEDLREQMDRIARRDFIRARTARIEDLEESKSAEREYFALQADINRWAEDVQAFCLDHTVGWDEVRVNGEDLPFTPENLGEMMTFDVFNTAVGEAWRSLMNGSARLGNSGAPRKK